MIRVCQKVCKECPFSSGSAKGWLGHHTIKDVLEMMDSEYPFSCHLHRTNDTTIYDVVRGKIPVCRGFILSATKSCKRFGSCRIFGESLRALQVEAGEAGDDILTKWDFAEHHNIRA